VSYSSRIQVPHPCAKSEILVRNPTLLKLFIDRNLTHIFILKRDVSIFMPDVLLGTTRVPFFGTAASIFMAADHLNMIFLKPPVDMRQGSEAKNDSSVTRNNFSEAKKNPFGARTNFSGALKYLVAMATFYIDWILNSENQGASLQMRFEPREEGRGIWLGAI